jgi:hypothetical protein
MCARSTRLLVPVLLGATVVWAADRGLLARQSAAPTDSRVIGTWLLNVAKSKFIPGPPYRGETRTYEPTEQGIKATIKRTFADGRTATIEYVANYDSLEYPVTGSPDYDAIRLTKVDALTYEAVLGHAGSVFAVTRRVISADGKTMTITLQAPDIQGSRVNNVMVYDKQR